MIGKAGDGERFLAVFGQLKAAVDDDPGRLEAAWPDNNQLHSLCDELAQLVRRFETIEEWSQLAFTDNVSPAGARARRDYDERWRGVVTDVANRELAALLDEILGGDFVDDTETNDTSPASAQDQLADEIVHWKDAANEDAAQIKRIIDYLFQLRELDDDGDREWIDEGLHAWDRLEVSGLDIAGALWRRRALPHVLVPVQVARHYGASKRSLHRRLHQAGKAFVFGAPLAALALQRAVIEEVLSKHWGAEKGWVRDANLPDLSWESRAHRLKRLANDALHGDPERLTTDELDRSIIENFLLLRLLIERAPEDLAAHSEGRS